MILEVKDLNVAYREKNKNIQILSDLSFCVKKNECLGVLGESGSGKSVTWKALCGLLDERFSVKGEVIFKQKHSLLNEKQNFRGKEITAIVQSPMTSFNPLFSIKNQMIETFVAHKNISKSEAFDLSVSVLNKMMIKEPKDVLKKFPHQLSGGMLQRIMIAIAIALSPSLLIADEPTTAIDSINQIEVLRELKALRDKEKISMIFISHDLHVLSLMADKILVMHGGKIVEIGTKDEIMNNPKKAQTKYLVDTRMKLFDKFRYFTQKS